MKLPYERPVITRLTAGPLNKFGPRAGQRAVEALDGVPVARLREAFGSPLFVLSEATLRRAYHRAVRAFGTRYPAVQLAWSYKTNYLNAVCRVLHQEGAWAEVVSGMELEKAVRNGVPGNRILFNGPAKSGADLRRAVALDAVIHLDHFDELHTLLALAPELPRRPRVAVRVSLDTGHYPRWDRFGFPLETGQAWQAVERVAASPALELVGLHCHIGTFVTEPRAYAVAAEQLSRLALRARRELGAVVSYLDLGGGFPSANTLKGAYLPGSDTVPPLDAYAEAISGAILSAGFPPDELPLLVLEAGRALVDDAGSLLGSVVATKRLADGRRATIVDFGVNLLFTSYWYDHAVSPTRLTSTQTEPTVLLGPLCMNIDVVRESVNLPLLAPGDQVVVHRVGAYNLSQWQQFISLRPNVVLIDKRGQPHVIRAAETLDYLEQLEQVPAHLAGSENGAQMT